MKDAPGRKLLFSPFCCACVDHNLCFQLSRCPVDRRRVVLESDHGRMAAADVVMRPLKRTRLGPPDCYPQDPKQPEVISSYYSCNIWHMDINCRSDCTCPCQMKIEADIMDQKILIDGPNLGQFRPKIADRRRALGG